MDRTAALTAYQLANLLQKVDPHIGRHTGYASISGVLLDSDGTRIHAVATDRHTLAVARQQIAFRAAPWSLLINAEELQDDLAALRTWIASHRGEHNILLTAGDHQLTVTSRRGRIVLPARDGAVFPQWRGLIRTAIEHEPGQAPYTGLSTDLLARWKTADYNVRTWQPAPDKPLVVITDDFIGLQMPTRPRRPDEAPTLAEDHDTWADSLGGGDKVELADTLTPGEAANLDERDNPVVNAQTDLLRTTLCAVQDVMDTPTRNLDLFHARVGHAAHGWMAYRFLEALRKTDPSLARRVVDTVTEEIDGGEIGEFVWDAAITAGHNPQQWRKEYNEARVKRTTENTTDPAATTQN